MQRFVTNANDNCDDIGRCLVTIIELAIAPGQAAGTFRVEVVRSSAGEASAVVDLDVEALSARREQLEQAVLASAVASRAVLPGIERPLREIGQVLFSALLGSGDVAGRYRANAALAIERGQGLRVVLRTDTPPLAGLPWEAMYDPVDGGYVCRRDQLVRHVPVAAVVPPLTVQPPLRILGVVSSPRGLPALDVEKEQEQLSRALARPGAEGLVELHWAAEATWAALQDLLLGGQWHVVHFIGHGDFDISRDEGVLALTREDGRADLVEAGRLVDLLHEARPMPRLVVLNSCSGAATGADDLFASTAAALVRGGISAVAAMQYSISDAAAVAFARGFYGAVAHGRGIDDAMSSGRVAILGLSGQTLEWVTPVLYLRGSNTQLFTTPEPAARSRPESRTEPSQLSARHALQPTGRGPLYAAFWQRFLEQLRAKHPEWSHARKGPADNWLSMPSPFPGQGAYCVSFPSGQRLRCELYLDWPDAAQVQKQYNDLYQHRDEIEARFGDQLSWESLESRRASRIAILGHGAIAQTDRHEEFIDWFMTNLERLRAALDPYARTSRTAEQLITDRWNYTSDGANAPAAMSAMEIVLPGTGYRSQPGERLAWVRFAALVGCSEISPDNGGARLWPQFQRFLKEQPVTSLVNSLSSSGIGLTWTRWATNSPGVVDAILTPDGENQAVASARLEVPDGMSRQFRDPRSAMLIVHFEPAQKGGRPIFPAGPVSWTDHMLRALELPHALAAFLSRVIGLVTSSAPPVTLGFRFEAQHDMAEFFDATGLHSLPGGQHRSQAIGYFIADQNGISDTDAANRMITDVLRYALQAER